MYVEGHPTVTYVSCQTSQLVRSPTDKMATWLPSSVKQPIMDRGLLTNMGMLMGDMDGSAQEGRSSSMSAYVFWVMVLAMPGRRIVT